MMKSVFNCFSPCGHLDDLYYDFGIMGYIYVFSLFNIFKINFKNEKKKCSRFP